MQDNVQSENATPYQDNLYDLHSALMKDVNSRQASDSESWLISYTDMVTLLITLFLFMLANSAYVNSADAVVPRMLFETLKTQASQSPVPEAGAHSPAAPIHNDPRMKELKSSPQTLALTSGLKGVLVQQVSAGSVQVDINAETVSLVMETNRGITDLQPILHLLTPLLTSSGEPVVIVDQLNMGASSAVYALNAMDMLLRGGLDPHKLKVVIPATTEVDSSLNQTTLLQIILK